MQIRLVARFTPCSRDEFVGRAYRARHRSRCLRGGRDLTVIRLFFFLLQVNDVRVGNGVRRRTRSERRATRVVASFTLPSSSVAPVSLTNFTLLASLQTFPFFPKLNVPAKYGPAMASLRLGHSPTFEPYSREIFRARTLPLIKRDAGCLTLATP